MLEFGVVVGTALILQVATILALRPTTAGPLVLGVGIAAQSVILALFIVPVLGPRGAYAALWKEAAVGLLILALTLRRDRSVARRLPVPVLVVLTLTALQLVIYAALPTVTSSSGAPTPGATARLAGLRQWIVPLELLLLGSALHNGGLTTGRLLTFSRRFGTSVAAIAIAGLFVLPLTFWVRVNSGITAALSGDASTASGQLEALQSYFLGQAVPRAVAPFGSPLALAFSLLLPLCLLWANRRRGKLTPSMLLVAMALVLSQTRGVLVGIVIVWLLSKVHPRNLDSRLVLGIVVLVGLALGPLNGAIVNTVTFNDPSSKLHYLAIRDGFSQLLDNPVGIGLGQGGQVGRAFSDSRAGGESLFLVAGNERGWVGLILIVALFAACWHTLRPRDRNEKQGTRARALESEVLRRGLRGAIAVLVFGSITTEHAVAFTSSWLLWVAVGYGVTSVGRPRVVQPSQAPVWAGMQGSTLSAA